MRNIFDQYSQPENRLTHALLSCLDRDRALLQRFISWSVEEKVKGNDLTVLEQSLPGEPPDLSEDESERRGLPDGCIYDINGWALLIETKYQAIVTAEQLRRHGRAAARRGIGDSRILVLTAKPVRQRLPESVVVRRWTEVYEWLQGESKRSLWARACREYLEVAEAREAANGYLDKGALTVFSGIPFGKGEPYTYGQAKRLLGLLRDELKADRRLEKRLGADPESPGRGAITGRAANAVWDFIGLKQARNAKQFTRYPHLTLGIQAERLEAYITVPNGIRAPARSRLLGQTYEDFETLIRKVTEPLVRVVHATPISMPKIVVVQRHYLSQRSQGIHDCLLRFDPRTAIAVDEEAQGPVKVQPQWLQATYEALRSRKSNLQFQVGVDFPYTSCSAVETRTIIKACADVWLACAPIIAAATTE